MKKNELPFRKHIFVCVNRKEEGPSCDPRGGGKIRDLLKAYVKSNGLKDTIRVSQSGCMDQCQKGPNVMVFPDQSWYSEVSIEDVPTLIKEIMPTQVVSTRSEKK